MNDHLVVQLSRPSDSERLILINVKKLVELWAAEWEHESQPTISMFLFWGLRLYAVELSRSCVTTVDSSSPCSWWWWTREFRRSPASATSSTWRTPSFLRWRTRRRTDISTENSRRLWRAAGRRASIGWYITSWMTEDMKQQGWPALCVCVTKELTSLKLIMFADFVKYCEYD